MGGVTRKLFGGSKEKSVTEPVTIPRLPAITPSIRTGAGSRIGADLQFGRIGGQEDAPFGLTGVDIDVGLSPEIAALREEALTGRRGLIGDVRGDIETLRGLRNPFIAARTQPLIEQRERAAREASRRGVTGPLAALATNPFDRELAQQRTLAEFDTQAAIRSGQEQIRALLGDVSGEGRALLEQELRLLGLGQQEIQQIIGSQLEQTVAQRRESDAETDTGIFQPLSAGNLLTGIGDIFRGP